MALPIVHPTGGEASGRTVMDDFAFFWRVVATLPVVDNTQTKAAQNDTTVVPAEPGDGRAAIIEAATLALRQKVAELKAATGSGQVEFSIAVGGVNVAFSLRRSEGGTDDRVAHLESLLREDTLADTATTAAAVAKGDVSAAQKATEVAAVQAKAAEAAAAAVQAAAIHAAAVQARDYTQSQEVARAHAAADLRVEEVRLRLTGVQRDTIQARRDADIKGRFEAMAMLNHQAEVEERERRSAAARVKAAQDMEVQTVEHLLRMRALAAEDDEDVTRYPMDYEEVWEGTVFTGSAHNTERDGVLAYERGSGIFIFYTFEKDDSAAGRLTAAGLPRPPLRMQAIDARFITEVKTLHCYGRKHCVVVCTTNKGTQASVEVILASKADRDSLLALFHSSHFSAQGGAGTGAESEDVWEDVWHGTALLGAEHEMQHLVLARQPGFFRLRSYRQVEDHGDGGVSDRPCLNEYVVESSALAQHCTYGTTAQLSNVSYGISVKFQSMEEVEAFWSAVDAAM